MDFIPYPLHTLTRPVLSLLAFPLHIISSVFRFIFGILRIPVPQFRFSNLTFYRPLRPRPNNTEGPDRWVRELEEELGAICIGRLKLPRGISSSSGVEVGPSRLVARAMQPADTLDDDRKFLPDFVICGYEEFLRTCQREAKIGCVILVTEEHDDTAAFKRFTLTDTTFVKVLYNNNILVWGGDVRDLEAWNASEKLQATTYPFIGFVALQPRRTPASSTPSNLRSPISQPVLTVLSRHQGKSYPSDTGPTSAQTVIEHLDRQLLPRVTPFLERIRAQQRERDRDRQLREEQDRAFQDAAKRDKDRIEAKIAGDKAVADAKRKAEEEAKVAALRKEQEEVKARKMEELRMKWRCWARNAIVAPTLEAGGNLRIAIRLINGTRIVQGFAPTTSLTALYAFVDSQLIPSHLLPQDDPMTIPEGADIGEKAIEHQISKLGSAADWWGFQLATSYPRAEIPWKSHVCLGELAALRGGGQVVVETLINSRDSMNRSINADDGDDDGEYKTESDEE